MTTASGLLDGLCLRGLLRHFGGRERSAYGGPVTAVRREDVGALRMWWALSDPVRELAERIASNPRQLSPALDDFRREVSGEIPGPPDAAASALLQALSCDPAAFVVTETSDTWLSGPNKVIARTLDTARGALRATALHARDGFFDEVSRERLAKVDSALRTGPMRAVLSSPVGRSKVVAHERRQAAKARAPIYRMAWRCASELAGIEELRPEVVSLMLSRELLPRLEEWARFELACVLEVSDALSAATGHPCALETSFRSDRPAATVGPFDVCWQRSIRSRPYPDLDEGERLAVDLSSSLGAAPGTGRSDIVVRRGERILSIIECKWFGSESSELSRIQEACVQLSCYARDCGWHQGEDPRGILERSLVAVGRRVKAPLRVGAGPVGCVGLGDLGGNALAPWAVAVAAA